MKTYNERSTDILEKVEAKRKKRNTIRAGIGSALCLAIVVLGIGLFTPYDTTLPSVEQYAASEYYSIIEKLNILTYDKPDYKNAFEEYIVTALQSGKDLVLNGTGSAPDMEFDVEEMPSEDNASGEANTSQSYEEVTDNQVSGVIEGDIFKRSDKYIYYFRNMTVSVYSIEGEDSKEIGTYELTDKDGYKVSAYGSSYCEMFLSKDCKTVIILTPVFNPVTYSSEVMLVSLDVSDPTNIVENQRSYLTGEYLSARMIDNELLIMAHYNSRWKRIDFSDETTFVPQYGTYGNMKCIEASNIICPKELTSTNYTVVCKIDMATLEAKSTGAFLDYANEVYVSTERVYATRTYSLQEKDASGITRVTRMTEISALNYSGEAMVYEGSTSVAGYIENQYYLDEYDGILRIVTTTDSESYIEHMETNGDSAVNWFGNYTSSTNASLYCIDLATWQVIASVEGFAPEGETVESVRFDGDNAYVCTAVVITLTDPVFYFDLSDLNNITGKDTGTIEGYSSSLVNFGDFLLGIGVGEDFDSLKIEMYQETATGVEAVCSYNVPSCNFSTEYKSYLIDRENMRIGLGYSGYDENGDYDDCYVLLQFDGYKLFEYVHADISSTNQNKRAVIIDDYIYIFGDYVENNFVVIKL